MPQTVDSMSIASGLRPSMRLRIVAVSVYLVVSLVAMSALPEQDAFLLIGVATVLWLPAETVFTVRSYLIGRMRAVPFFLSLALSVVHATGVLLLNVLGAF